MATMVDVCSAFYDNEKSFKAFKLDLDTTLTDFLQVVNEITESQESKDVNAAADEALAEFDKVFATSSLGSGDAVRADSGIPAIGKDADQCLDGLALRGYLYANSRFFFCGTRSYPMNRSLVDNGNYRYRGVLDGEYSVEAIKSILPNYTEPNITSLLKDQTTKKTVSSHSYQSWSPLLPSPDGNLAQLRELYRGCGGSLSVLKKFLTELTVTGYGVLYSKVRVISMVRPFGVKPLDFDFTYVRSSLSFPILETDILKTSDEYLVLVEEQGSIDDFDIARVVNANHNEAVRNQAPLFVSRGFQPSKLSPSAYLLGVIVNGIARVVDITSDAGRRLYCTEYTAQDVATALCNVFPDFLETGVIGTEFFVTTKGSGPYNSIEFFPLGEDTLDASAYLGIESAVQKQYSSTYKFTKTLAYLGGVSPQKQTSYEFVASLKRSKLTTQQVRNVLATPANYWDKCKQEIQPTLSALDDLFTPARRASVFDVTASIEDVLSVFNPHLSKLHNTLEFVSVDNLRAWELMDILNALGDTDAVSILARRVDVTEVDPYTDAKLVYDSLKADFAKAQANNGMVTVNKPMLTQSPRELNTTQVHTATLLYAATVNEYLNADGSSAVSYYDRFQQACGIVITSESITSVSDTNNIISSFDSLLPDYLGVLTGFTPVLNVDVSEVDRSIANYAKVNNPELFKAMTEAKSVVSLEDSDASSVMHVLNSLQDDALRYLKQADAIMATVQAAAQGFAATYQATYDKIMGLANTSLNIYGSQGFNTKYLSCYVNGSVSLLLGQALVKYLQKLNEIAAKLNKILQKIIDAVKKFADKMSCLTSNMSLQLSGYMSYTTVSPGAGGLVQFNMSCTMPTGLGLDPQIGATIASILGRVISTLDMFKLALVTFEQQDKNSKATLALAQADLLATLREAVDKLKSCL